ncbi:glycine cleavage system protein GcvH [Alicyclobacillus acidocaldarius]|uniref:Glycine cleavage system H protein n=1 Tax=Alicyclobacillus acidocaldarius (strain Tc-4-1) TaxID=1048834 RepID=F8IK13_ALIAT|nr:glycine cleavage system protein GcvH [Alicyclobacillus acidocaldarius]AEJ43525.1 glycine cleavage system H protein [Alicyclobacillus acidocaldarius subsp. acidocaldarius Tc-4-1]
MNIPEGLKYSREHEWVRVDGSRAYIGITDYAQDELGDIVYVELPEKGAELKAGETFGTVESVKTVSDLYAPVSGRVIEVNEALANAPEKVNESPYEEAWMIVVEMSDPSELEALLDAEAYRQHIQR